MFNATLRISPNGFTLVEKDAAGVLATQLNRAWPKALSHLYALGYRRQGAGRKENGVIVYDLEIISTYHENDLVSGRW